MMPVLRVIPGILLRLIVNAPLMLVFMCVADHWMRATYDTVWVGTPVLVNMGGALVYLLFVYLTRALLSARRCLCAD